VYVWSPVSSRFDFVFFGHHVSEADFLRAIETEVGLFVDLGGAIRVRGYGAVFHGESLAVDLESVRAVEVKVRRWVRDGWAVGRRGMVKPGQRAPISFGGVFM